MIELVRGRVTRTEHKHGDRGVFFDVTHKFGIPLHSSESTSWFLHIPLDVRFDEGEEVVIYIKTVLSV